MNIEHRIRLLAGTLILVSLTLGYFFSSYWFLLTALVGFNLMQSSFTRFCPAEIIFSKIFFKK